MPTVFRYRGYRYANEGDPREPVHIRVEQAASEAKFWLVPQVQLAYNDGFNSQVLRALMGVIEARRELIERAWHEFFG